MSSPRWSGNTLGGRYQIEDLLGQGGMSSVYKAMDPNLDRTVAIKLIHPHLADISEFVERFRKEASVVAQMRHPNIVQVFDFNHDADEFYMVMEFVPGETLRDRLARLRSAGADMSLVEAMKYAINICDAADYAHRADLIHRDIKPANVMLDLQEQAILMDFGIAKIVGGPQFTATGATIGTAMYMSPEQIRGERIDERSDIYAIGVVLFEMLSGRPPFQSETPTALLMMHLGDPVPDVTRLRPECPAELRAIVEKAMAKDRAQRYQHASEMSAALRKALSAYRASLHAPTTARPAAADAAAPTVAPRAARPAAGADTVLPRADRLAAAQAETMADAGSPRTRQSTTPRAATAPAAAPPAAAAPPYVPPEVVNSGKSRKGLLLAGCLLPVGALALIGGLVLVVFLLTRPADEQGSTGSETAIAGSVQTETEVAILPPAIETPTGEPAATATPAPTNTPAPTATPEPSPTAAPRSIGLLTFQDNDQSRAGSFQLIIGEAGSTAEDSHYTLWAGDPQSPVFLAAIEPGSGINISGDTGENLLAVYDQAFITVESNDHDGLSPSGDPLFVTNVSVAALASIRQMLITAPDTPGQEGYLVGIQEQVQLASDHAGFLADSLQANDLATAKMHAEHVVNILVGEEGDAFGDLNGDGTAQNPGNGYGVLRYLEKAREQAQLATAAEGAGQEVTLHAEHTIISIDNALSFLDNAARQAGRVIASDTVGEARDSAAELAVSLDALLNGVDTNGDGIIAPAPDEGAILLAYEHALKMGSYEFFSAQDVPAD